MKSKGMLDATCIQAFQDGANLEQINLFLDFLCLGHAPMNTGKSLTQIGSVSFVDATTCDHLYSSYFQTIPLGLVANMVYRRTELIRYIHKDHFNVNLQHLAYYM